MIVNNRGLCDSCGRALDPVVDANRFRHAGCPVPALPEAALMVFDKVNRFRKPSAVEPAPALEAEVE